LKLLIKVRILGGQPFMPHKDADARKEYMTQYHKEWYQAHKDVRRRQIQEKKRRLREWLRMYTLERKCVKCGYDKCVAALEFHHRDPATKKFTIAQAVSMGYSKNRIQQEIAKCDVLCANCHREHHWQ
jgi:excinuclease UvrABC ATPase subunit